MNFKIISFNDIKKLILSFTIITIFILLSISVNYSCSRVGTSLSTSDSAWTQLPSVLEKIVAPKFPDKEFIITNYGAANDGKTLCTKAIAKAIDECSKAGGGKVVIPKGTFLTGAIHLKSNVNLYVSEGAVLKFSTNPRDYLPVVFTRWEGVECMNYSPLIYAYKQENVALTGKGLLDGGASEKNWWKWKGNSEFGDKNSKENQANENSRPRLMKLGDENVPVKDRIFGEGTYLRPTFVEFYNCKNVLIQGVSLKDSPFWFLHPTLSTNVTIDGVTVTSRGPNTDGCDPESCSFVLIKNCEFNVGDDCIAIKSGRNNDGRRVNVPSTNIVIQNCKMKDGHGGVVIGSEITGGCENVFAEDCEMDSPNLDRMLRIKSNSKRGGVVKNIYVRNIKVGEVGEAIVKLNLKYDPKEAEGFSFYPKISNVNVENVTSNKSKYGLFIDGLKNSVISDIIIKDCKFNGVQKGNLLSEVKNLEMKNVYINGELQK